MADQGSPAGQGKKNLSMELRLLLAFVLMGLVLFLTPYFYKAQAPPRSPVKPAPQTQQPTPQQAVQPPAAQPPSATGQAGAPVAAEKAEEFRITTTALRHRLHQSRRGSYPLGSEEFCGCERQTA